VAEIHQEERENISTKKKNEFDCEGKKQTKKFLPNHPTRRVTMSSCRDSDRLSISRAIYQFLYDSEFQKCRDAQ
jgi:hypothetical protein